jgi:hypothetical protein
MNTACFKEVKMKVKNKLTGEIREIKEPTFRQLERVVMEEANDRCVGPCKCELESDGECANGWVSRCRAAGLV